MSESEATLTELPILPDLGIIYYEAALWITGTTSPSFFFDVHTRRPAPSYTKQYKQLIIFNLVLSSDKLPPKLRVGLKWKGARTLSGRVKLPGPYSTTSSLSHFQSETHFIRQLRKAGEKPINIFSRDIRSLDLIVAPARL